MSDLPNVDFPTISVSASLPGANPDTMATSVALPLEKEFSTIAGVDSMTSSSSLGNTNIVLQFALDRDIDAAAQDVQAAISRASRQLPQDMPAPPTYQKVNPADQPILYIALTSPSLPLYELDEYGQTMMAQRSLHRLRGGPGDGVRVAKVRSAHPARPGGPWPPAAWVSTRSRGRCRPPT